MAVGEAFLSAFLQVLFDRLASKHVLDFVRGHDIENDLKILKKTLRKVNGVLNDAEDKQFKDEEVKMWLDELKDAAYDAEDVLDEFATEALQLKLEAESQPSSNQLLSSISAYLNPSIVGMESKIQAITKRFDDLAKERFELGLEEVDARSPSIKGRETSSVMDKSRVYGRDNDKEKIIQLLLNDDTVCDNKFSVISIVAMGGVGKTTLSQIVYNDDKVKGHFDLKAWVCVSEEFDVKRITKDILFDFTSDASDSDNLNRLQVKLEEALTEKKFLIVLDDVWCKKDNYRDWDVLQNPFGVGATGSKIIVTTRNKDVALMMGTVEYHYLEHLSNDDCWSVFVRHAFVNKDIDTKPKLVVTGKKIVEKCKGLPLAAKMLGGLLRSKLEEDEWEDILNSEIWEPEVVDDILPMLRLSYNHLPSHLKRCFAYCSILPKGYEFKEVELVLLWMAEGLVQQSDRKKQMEDVGLTYFRELWSRSFFQPSRNNESLFVMHDLINDLAQWVAGKTCFRLEGEKQCKISQKARHSSYVGSRFDGVKKFKAFDEVKSLWTLLALMTRKESYLTNYVPVDLLPQLSCLRVLSLSGYRITELPNSIGAMKHLRYLDLSHTFIRSLPESTSTLYNLQTLILKDCSCLKKLPTEMRNLINLRHLDITYAYLIKEMPPGVGELTNLLKLSNFIVGNNGDSGIRELMKLKRLRGTLHISRLENVIDTWDAREASLEDKQALDVLTVEWSSEFNDSRNERVEKEVLDMLQPRNKMLKELTIKSYGGIRLPTWVGDPSFSNMVLLRLVNCVQCTSLPLLGQLPSLKELCIKGMNKVNSVGHEFYGEGCPKPFASLETLSFDDMQEWKDWFHCGADRHEVLIPRLCELSIIDCPKLLARLPSHLPSLEKLIIRGCQQLAVSISSLPKHCELDIQGYQEMVQRSMADLSSLKFMVLSNISNLIWLTEGFVQGLTKVEDLEIVGCNELTSLWQKEIGLLQHLTSLHRLRIQGCPKFVSLVEEEAEEQLQQQLGVPCRLEYLRFYSCDNLEKLQGLHSLTSLRELTIQGCPRLVSFPETGLPSMLRKLRIGDCSALKSLPRAIMHCSNYASLEYLSIDSCDSLTSIARGQLPSTLKKLKIKYCQNLQSLVDEEEGSTSSSTSSSSLTMQKSNNNSACLLQHLYIERCPSLTSLSSRGELPATLKYLGIHGCPMLESVAERLHNNMSLESILIEVCERLESLPEGRHNLSHLCEFKIIACPSLVSFPDGGLLATNLRELWIAKCEKLEALPDSMHDLTSLQDLTILGCPGIVTFPDGGLPATNLRKLWIRDCKKLEALPDHMHNLTSLRDLIICKCPSLVTFPDGGLPATNLRKLWIKDCEKLEALPDRMHNLASLQELVINKCPILVTFPDGGLPATNLRKLWIEKCEKLEALPDRMHNLTSLRELTISSCQGIISFLGEGFPTKQTTLESSDFKIDEHRFTSLRDLQIYGGCTDLVSFPAEEEAEEEEGMNMMLPTSLKKLTIGDFPNLEHLPSKAFQNLTSLSYLSISNCPMLKSFPKEGLPPSLSKGFQNLTSLAYLSISACPRLKSFPEEGLPPTLLQLRIYQCPLLQQRCKKDQGRDWPKIAHIPCVKIDHRFIFDPEEETTSV